MRRTRNAFLAVLAITGTAANSDARAQAYPSRPITMIAPFGAGGGTDTLARILAEGMKASLGQPVIVENITGAAGSIGVGQARRAAPDGYTLILGNWATFVVNGAVRTLPYDLQKDFEPVALTATQPLVLVANNDVPAKDLKELVSWLKSNPDKATVGTTGVGSAVHLAALLFQAKSETNLLLVPYRGGGLQTTQDLLGGHINLQFTQASNALPQVRAGKIKAYAVTAKARLSAAPDIPTVDEAGLPGLYVSLWHALWAPKGTPKDVIAKLNIAVTSALSDPETRQKLARIGQEIFPSDRQSPEALAAFHKSEIEKWWPIIKAANIRAE